MTKHQVSIYDFAEQEVFTNRIVGSHGQGENKSVVVETVIRFRDYFHSLVFVVKNNGREVLRTYELRKALRMYNEL